MDVSVDSVPVSTGLFVEFYAHPEEDPEATKEAGYKQYKDVDYVRITMDNGLSVVDRAVKLSTLENELPIEEDDSRRFPMHWKLYKEGRSQKDIGLPLDRLFIDSPSKVKFYEQMNIYSVEQLSLQGDDSCQRLGMGAMEDRKAAQKFLEKLKEIGKTPELQKQLDETKSENKELRDQLNILSDQLQALIKAQALEDLGGNKHGNKQRSASSD